MKHTILLVALVPVLVIGSLVAVPQSAAAADGEVLSRGTNVCTDIYKYGNSARVDCSNLGDCPAGISGCWVEIRWYTQCEWAWCTTYDPRTSWIRLGVGQDAMSYCYNGKQRWRLDMRLAWASTAGSKSVETWGQNESQLTISGLLSYRLIPKFLFNVTNNTGFRYGTKITTQYGTTGYAGTTTVATSGGQYITLSC